MREPHPRPRPAPTSALPASTRPVGALAESEAGLVRSIAEREHGALAEIYRRYGGAVWGLSSRVCRDAELAREVCQTVFCELWASPHRYDPTRGGFRSWLLAQTHGRAVDAVRSEAARRRREERVATMAPPVSAEVESIALLSSLRDSVRLAVDRLPVVERDAILLTYLGGHTCRDAARRLGQPEGTVKSRIRSGMARLRTTLEAQDIQGVTS
jgi:RNA polymerase sigma-70 factor (ECF subfamily)